MALPTVTGIWRAGTDPEIRFTPGGTQVCSFRAVASSSKQNPDGSWTDTGEIWVRVTIFGEYGEYVANAVTRGQRFSMLGKIKVDTYEDREGAKRESVEVLADAIAPLPEKKRDEQSKTTTTPAGQKSSDEPPF